MISSSPPFHPPFPSLNMATQLSTHDQASTSTNDQTCTELVNYNFDEEAQVSPQASPSISFSSNYKTQLHPEKKTYGIWETILLAYQTLGIVYGDLGTSPLYVFSSIEYKLEGETDFLGVLSILFWTLTLVALCKYVFIVLRADDHGEGGTFAVYSLLCQHAKISQNGGNQYSSLECDTNLKYFSRKKNRTFNSKALQILESSKTVQKLLLILVMVGTCMVIGDGVLTPAISVMSAVVGIKSHNPQLSQTLVVAVSVVILLLLFFLQRFGTSRVSFLFSPIMVAWFLSTALIGTYNIAMHYPGVFKALSPHYIISFFMSHQKNAWVMLGAVVLCITGAEAMFADLGHFNKRSIQIAFTIMVYPSLLLTYAGQAAYLIKNPADLGDAFFKSIPQCVFWPMFVVSTLAAIVASQSLISATYSIVKQSMALGLFPRVKIIHTSKKQEGQIYSPEVNYTLMIFCLAVVLGFQSGTQIGNAFGVAVIWVMLITTFLVTIVMLVIWVLPLPLILGFFCLFGLVEGTYMTSVMNKVPQGGWVPFAISAFFLFIMLCWNYGRKKKYEYGIKNTVTLDQLEALVSDSAIARVPGVCFFYTDLVDGFPPIVHHYVRNVGALHEVLIFVTIRHIPVKTVLPEERFLVDTLGFRGAYRCIARYGYKDVMKMQGEFLDEMVGSLKKHLSKRWEEQNGYDGHSKRFPDALDASARSDVLNIDAAKEKRAVFVIGKIILRTKENSKWYQRVVIDRVFTFLAKNCRSAMETLHLPPSQSLQVGMLYEI